jgi:hypothetical protein
MDNEFSKALVPTECISYPRSGHHALVDLLRAYFGEGFVYGEIYREPTAVLGSLFPPVNYQKNHDFDLLTPVDAARNYLVQVRNPLESIESWETFDRRVGHTPDTAEARLDFWNAFVKKWVFGEVPNRLVVWYEDLVGAPVETCTAVIQFLTRTQNVDMDLLARSLALRPLARRRPHVPRRYLKA